MGIKEWIYEHRTIFIIIVIIVLVIGIVTNFIIIIIIGAIGVVIFASVNTRLLNIELKKE